MALYRLESAHQIGPFKWGTKLGSRVDEMGDGISVDERKWYESEGSCLVPDEYTECGSVRKWRRESYPWWNFSGLFVTIQKQNVVTLTSWADDDTFGYVQTTLGDLTGEEINQHPIVGSRLRYVPD